MRLAAPTDARNSLPRSRRVRCHRARNDTVLSSKNLSKCRRPMPRYRNFQIDTKNGRLTPIRIVLARNILRAHPTLVPKRGCVSAPAMVPLWSGLFYCRALQRKAFGHCPTPRQGNRLSPGDAFRQASRASSHGRQPTSRASRKIPPHELRIVTPSQPLSASCAPFNYEKLSQNPWLFAYPVKTRLTGHASPASPARCIVDMKSR